MPETLPDHAPRPIAVIGWDGARYRVFAVDATGHLNVNVLANVGLDDALQSVATDRLIVRGEDQLFSFQAVLAKDTSGAISAADGDFDSAVVPAGEVWIVTTIAAVDTTSPVTIIYINNHHDGRSIRLQVQTQAFAAGEYSCWAGFTSLDVGDFIRVNFTGGLAGDTCAVFITGYIMTKET